MPSLTGTHVEIDARVDNSNTSVTIPVTADGVVAFVTHYDGVASTMDTLTINSVTMLPALAEVADQENGDHAGQLIAHLRSPATGTQTVAWGYDAGGDRGSDGHIILIFYADTGGGTTVRDSAANAQQSGTPLSVTVSTEVGDLFLGHGSSFSSSSGTIDSPAGTVINPTNPYSPGTMFSRVYDLTESATSTQVDKTTANFAGVSAIALQETAAGGANPKGPLGMPLHGTFGGPV